MKTTWMENGRKHIATNGGFPIGHVTVMLAKTDRPFLGVSANGMVKQFALLLHAKEWVEDLFADIADEFHAANADQLAVGSR